MEEIKALLRTLGYRNSKSDQRNDIWIHQSETTNRKIYIPVRGNTLMFYDCKQNGSPISYIEFHNCYDKDQIDRLSKIA